MAIDSWVQVMRIDDDCLVKVAMVMLEALELGSVVGEGFAPEFEEVWVEWIRCNGTEWIDGKGSEGAIERHSMVKSKIRLERESSGDVETGNDWEVDGKLI